MLQTRLSTRFLIILSCCWLFACGIQKTAQPSTVNTKATPPSPKTSIVEKLKEHGDLPVAERIALYYKLKKESPEIYDFSNEDNLTMYGYGALWAKKTVEAIEIFKLIVQEFPGSSNAYDSLGEGYLQNGDTALSLFNYEKSLAMNPDNFNAEDQIERIKYPERKPETSAEKFAKVYTAKEYREDLDKLGEKLLAIHPAALKFISKEEFLKTIEQKKTLVTDRTTYSEFVWHCSEIIASVHCSHTGMNSFYLENEMLPPSLRFPLQTRLVNGQLFAIDSLNNTDKVRIKDEILSINGIPVSSVISNIYRHIPNQGHIQTTKRLAFNFWSNCLIPYELGFPETYTITIKGAEKPVVLNKGKEIMTPYARQPFKRSCKDNLCFEVLSNSKNAVLTVSSFNYYSWDNFNVFKQFMDTTFAEIQEKGIENLIIDVRFNGGGSSESSIYLLQYLLDKPFVYYSQIRHTDGRTQKDFERITPFENRYKGKLFFIMDGWGNSTTGHFMSIVKTFKLGPIVGEELGSNQFCTAGSTSCRLPNTKLQYYIANNIHESSATSLPDERGIMPDHAVSQSIEDYCRKVDAVKEFTLGLMKK